MNKKDRDLPKKINFKLIFEALILALIITVMFNLIVYLFSVFPAIGLFFGNATGAPGEEVKVYSFKPLMNIVIVLILTISICISFRDEVRKWIKQ